MKTKIKTILYLVVFVIMLITLLFSSQLELLLKLKPDLKNVYSNSLTVHFVDVGQGEAILVRFPNNKTMLIDSGSEGEKHNLLGYINNVFFGGVKEVFDYVLLTHQDMDHMGNMLTILNSYKVNNFIRPHIYASELEEHEPFEGETQNPNYTKLIRRISELKINMSFLTPNFSDECLNEYMRILTPIKNQYATSNNYSPIMSLNFDGVRFMLTGDATIENEREAIANYAESELKCDVLKLGHHGSKTSTSEEFLLATSPKTFVISYGKNNSFLHPSDSVINNVVNYCNSANINPNNAIKETAKHGNIIFSVKDGKCFTTLIDNVSNYIFCDYWVVLLIVALLFCTTFLLPPFFRELKKQKVKHTLKH